MPILASETSLFPHNLLSDFTTVPSERRWWAVYTRSRMEKSLARQLLAMEVPYYLPLIPKTNRIAGRTVKSLLPLFGGYLFMYGNDEERIRALETNRVAHIWQSTQVDEMTRDLQSVQTLIESGVPLTPEGRLQPGDRPSKNRPPDGLGRRRRITPGRGSAPDCSQFPAARRFHSNQRLPG